MPYNSKLIWIGEGYQNDGKGNKVSFLIGEKHTYVSGKEQYSKNVRIINYSKWLHG